MAQFPKSQRKLSASGLGGQFRTRQPNTDVAKALQGAGDQLQRTGLTLQDIDDKITKISQARDSSDSRLKSQKIINDYTYKVNENTDPEAREGIYKSFSEDMRGVISDIKDPKVKADLTNEIEGDISDSILSFKIKELSADRTKSESNLAIQKQEYILASDSNDPQLILIAKKKYLKAMSEFKNLHNVSDEDIRQRKLDADKASASRIIDNATARNPQEAKLLLEDLAHNFNDKEVGKMNELINSAKTSAEYRFERAIEKSKLAGVNELQTQLDNGNLSLPLINSIEQSNPLIKELELGDKYRQLVVKKAADEGTLDGTVSIKLISDFYNVIGVKPGTSKGKVKGKKTSLSKDEIKNLLSVQGEFINAQNNSQLTIDETKTINKLFSDVLKENPRYIANFNYMSKVVSDVSDWSAKTSSIAKLVNPKSGVDGNNLAADLMNTIINQTKETSTEAEISELLTDILATYNKTIAHNVYQISKLGNDDYVLIGDSYYKVDSYSYGEPVFKIEEIDANNTK